VVLADIAVICFCVFYLSRAGRALDERWNAQRDALEAARGALERLVRDADERATDFERVLGARERSLRGLLFRLAEQEERVRRSDTGPQESPASEPEPAIIPAERAIDERIAYIMSSMLKDVIRRGTGTRARSLEREDLSGKTGTTNEAADTWFNGFNPAIVTTVWVGFPDHTPLGRREYGSNNPLPIWIEYMQAALDGQPEQPAALPAGVVTMKIDPRTGGVATPTQQDAIFEYFLKEHAPKPKPASRFQPGEPQDDLTPVDIF